MQQLEASIFLSSTILPTCSSSMLPLLGAHKKTAAATAKPLPPLPYKPIASRKPRPSNPHAS
eukprot:scaffold231847_cov22-Tisochrysis_lutea.AAC.2